MTFNKFAFLFLFVLTFSFFACDDDEVVIPVEEELITNVTLVLVPQGGGTSITLTFSDLDGDGGIPPLIEGGTLTENTVYNGTVSLSNASVSPAEDITLEIMEEEQEHQFFYMAASTLNLTIDYADQDADGNPLGLLTTFTTGAASTGNLTFVLRHEPDKNAAGVPDGDIANAGGETDIEVAFPISIQ
jgi:hypothetical protein